MSLDFKLRYDQLREGDPTKAEAVATNEENTFYDGSGHARNLCLVWPDGKRQFLNYAYLVGGTFSSEGEENEITLNFSAYVITLKGYGLEALFTGFLDQSPRQVIQIEQRYATCATGVIIEIQVHSIK